MPMDIQKAVDKELDRLEGERNQLEAEVSTESASVEISRSWTNGWDVAAYAKAWWKGKRYVEAGARAKKTW